MSEMFMTKITEISYVLVGIAILMGGIYFWESNQNKKESEKNHKEQ